MNEFINKLVLRFLHNNGIEVFELDWKTSTTDSHYATFKYKGNKYIVVTHEYTGNISFAKEVENVDDMVWTNLL